MFGEPSVFNPPTGKEDLYDGGTLPLADIRRIERIAPGAEASKVDRAQIQASTSKVSAHVRTILK